MIAADRKKIAADRIYWATTRQLQVDPLSIRQK